MPTPFAWPPGLFPQTVSWGIQKAGAQFRSPFAGSVEAVEFPGQFWRISVTLSERKLKRGSQAEAFFSRVAGGVERVLVPYWPRMIPDGTMRGTPTVSSMALRGDLTLSVATNGSLKAGDMIGAGAQTFQVFDDCYATGGVLTVPLVNRVRATIAAGIAVTWNAPTTTCLIPSMVSMAAYEPGRMNPLPVDLEEAP